MNIIKAFANLVAMRRKSASPMESIRWAAGLLWRNHQTSTRRSHIERRAEVERAARQRL